MAFKNVYQNIFHIEQYGTDSFVWSGIENIS